MKIDLLGVTIRVDWTDVVDRQETKAHADDVYRKLYADQLGQIDDELVGLASVLDIEVRRPSYASIASDVRRFTNTLRRRKLRADPAFAQSVDEPIVTPYDWARPDLYPYVAQGDNE